MDVALSTISHRYAFAHSNNLQLPPLTLPRHLFIHYKIGLNMGKPMGWHPIPITYSKIPKRTQKGVKIPWSILFSCTPSSTGCQIPKIGQTWPKISQNLVKGQQAPNAHLWLVLSHSSLTCCASKASSLDRSSSTCWWATTSCSTNSWMTTSLIGPYKHCLAVVETYSNSSPRPSTSVNNW
jgi:hypothetical protein